MGITAHQKDEWEISFDEVQITVVGALGEQILYTVPAGRNVRVTELTVRGNEISTTFIIQLQVSGVTPPLLSISIPENISREWESEAGRLFDENEAIGVKSWGVYGNTVYSDLGGQTLYVSGSGYEWTV